MAKFRRYLVAAGCVAIAWYGYTRYRAHKAAELQSRISECAGAKSNLKSAWRMFLLDAIIENNNTAVDAMRESDAAEVRELSRQAMKTNEELRVANEAIPHNPTAKDVGTLRELTKTYPNVTPPDFAKIEAELKLCER